MHEFNFNIPLEYAIQWGLTRLPRLKEEDNTTYSLTLSKTHHLHIPSHKPEIETRKSNRWWKTRPLRGHPRTRDLQSFIISIVSIPNYPPPGPIPRTISEDQPSKFPEEPSILATIKIRRLEDDAHVPGLADEDRDLYWFGADDSAENSAHTSGNDTENDMTPKKDVTDRAIWNIRDGDGPDATANINIGNSWKLYNPTMSSCCFIFNQVKNSSSLAQFNHLLPSRVKLSDSGMGLIIVVGVPVRDCNKNWPLDFNSNGRNLSDASFSPPSFTYP